MNYSVFASDDYTVTVSRSFWQILWRVTCQVEGTWPRSKPLPGSLSRTVHGELKASRELSPATREAVLSFAREAILEPLRERRARLTGAAAPEEHETQQDDLPSTETQAAVDGIRPTARHLADNINVLAWIYLILGIIGSFTLAYSLSQETVCETSILGGFQCTDETDSGVLAGVAISGVFVTLIGASLLFAVRHLLLLLEDIRDVIGDTA